MKNTLIAFTMILMVTFVHGQDQRPKNGERPSPEEMIEKATKELSLTDDQVKEWQEIHEKYAEAMKERSSARETRKKMGEELEATLTEEQLEKFKNMRPGARRKGGKG